MNERQSPSLSSQSSVTQWLDQIKHGEEDAAQLLWQRYLERLLRLAARRLANSPNGAADEEDVVLSAFDSFLRAAKDGRFPRLEDREDLWQVLVMLTDRKAGQQRRHERAAKRGAGKVRGDSALAGGQSDGPIGLDAAAGLEPTPQFAAEMREQLAVLLGKLGDDVARKIAVGKLSGKSNVELAADLQISLRSVERKLNIIRRNWQGERPE
jgi:DNA-directed RNA polymerase specialized sigma24 family protein